MRKIIAFLGKYPQQTRYEFRGQVYTGQVFPEALRQFVEFDEMLVFVTPEAREFAWPALEALGDPRIRPIDIPTGSATAEMWELFAIIIQQIHHQDVVIFDITHGLRSTPFLVFLFAAYLKTALAVTIEAIYYGAFELQDKKTGKPAPVIELSEFVSMLDWITATNQFIYTGNARYLSAQLRKEAPPALDPLADNVWEISMGLDLLRPYDVAKSTRDLPEYLRLAQDAAPPPFALLSKRLVDEYSQFACEDMANVQECLSRQLRMINWFYKANRYVHALALAREWLVSLICHFFQGDIKDKAIRDDVEILLGGGKRGARESRFRHEWHRVPQGKAIRKLWNELANLRNDVLHTGFRKNPRSIDEIVDQVKNCVAELNRIADVWQLQP